MNDRPDEPDREPLDLDTKHEPEPDWAEGIRRGRRDHAERLRRLLSPDETEDPPPP